MTNYRKILELYSKGYSQRSIETSVRSSHQTVRSALDKAHEMNISWPLEDDVTNEVLDELFYGKRCSNSSPYAVIDYAYIHRELSKKTAVHHLNLISDVFQYAIRMGMLCDNPCRRVFLPPIEHTEKEIFTLDEVQKLFENITGEPLKYQLFFTLAVYGGYRRSELLGLEWKDIDFENDLIHIRRTSQYTTALGIYTDTTKTKKSKRVSKMPTEIMDLLRRFKEEQQAEAARLGSKWEDHDRLFTKWNGEPMNTGTPYEWLKGYCDRMNVPFHNIHSLRHLHASLLIFEGVDVVAVSADMGHSMVGTTLNMYSHMFQEAKARSCDAISNALNFSTPPEKPTLTKCKCYELPFSGAQEA